MAVISITDASKITFYKNGSPGASEVVGYESLRTRVVRYEFTVPSPGSSSITAQISGPYHGNGDEIPIRFYIGTDPDSHVNAGAADAYTGTATINSASTSRLTTLSADIILVPNQTYYLWLFPSVNSFGWYYWSLNCTITTYGGSASQPTASASSVALGSPLTVYTNRAAGFTHELTYRFGNTSGTIATGVTDSYPWYPDVSLANQIPNDLSGIATIYCTTYDESGRQVGDPLSVSVTLTVPQSLAPTAGLTSVTDGTSAQNLVGYFVQNVSKLVIDAYGTAQYGASIVAVTMALDGNSYSGGLVTASGDLPLVIRVTDSRGLSGESNHTVHVEAYTPPRVNISASRCTEDGTADDTGEYANVTITGTTTAFDGANTATLTFTHRSQDIVSVSTGSFIHADRIYAPSTEVLTLTAVLHDKLSTAGLLQPGQSTMPLSVGYATMDFLKGGKGIAFGATATQEGFTCAMPARFIGSVEGVAPAGYGLGDILAPTAPAGANGYCDADAITSSGWYRAKTGTPKDQWWSILHNSYADGYATQYGYAYSVTTGAPNGTVIQRSLHDAVWDEWEYVNPPMEQGVEYRTTERYKGKAVYTKLVTYQASSIGGDGVVDITIPHNIPEFGELVRCGAKCSMYPLPELIISPSGNAGSTSVHTVDATNVKLRLINEAWNNGTFEFVICYTKS